MPVVLRVALPVPLPHPFDYLPPASGTASVGARIGCRSVVANWSAWSWQSMPRPPLPVTA